MDFADEFLYIHGSPTHLLSVHVADQGLLVGIFSSLMPQAYGRLFICKTGNLAGFLHSFVTDRTGHIGYTFGQKGFREAAKFFLQIDVAKIVIHKADQPNTSSDFFDTDSLTSEDRG